MIRFYNRLTGVDPLEETLSAPPEPLLVETRKDVFAAIVGYGWDTAMKYGIDTGFGAIQTVCAIVGVMGVGVAAVNAAPFQRRRPVRPLYDRLRAEVGHMTWPHTRFRFSDNPYKHLTKDKAVILQGRPQEGKTTLLRTSIPWWQRWNVWPLSIWQWKGIYLNGRSAAGKATFETWLTVQMLGQRTQAGAEVAGAIAEYRQSQWFRRFMEKCKMPFLLPKPLYVIVDQFEECIRQFPMEALGWADSATDTHTRNNTARLIFVVNSEAGAQSLLQKGCRGSRYNRIVMKPVRCEDISKVSAIDGRLLAMCENNVGLYTLVRAGLANGSLVEKDVPAYVQMSLGLWGAFQCLPFSYSLHTSWITVPVSEAKRRVAKALAAMLSDPGLSPGANYCDVRQILDVVIVGLRRLDAAQFYGMPEREWARVLSNEGVLRQGLHAYEAKVVAKYIKNILGEPVDKARPKPRWRMDISHARRAVSSQAQPPYQDDMDFYEDVFALEDGDAARP